MKTSHKITISFISIILFISSCVSNTKLLYLKRKVELDNSVFSVNDTRTTFTPVAYKLMPYDLLYISVVTPDPRWSTFFNTVPVGTGGGLTEQSAALLGYPVDDNGHIELPFIGKLKVGGKTISEIKIDLDSTLKNYVTDASITVRMVNNNVSILGEVNRPGRYPLIKDRLNIFEALSMAGDLNVYGNRQNVQLIRQSLQGPIVKDISLSDRSILTSEFFYIMPNDIIYAQPVKARSFQINSSTYTLILTSIVSILSSVTTLFIIFNYGR
jgi:polysaccharide export outer membrane protein